MISKQDILDNLDVQNFYSLEIASLKINGSNKAQGLCCFHKDTNPSLSINLKTGEFNCFGCNSKGSIFDFYMKKYEVDFTPALQALAAKAGLSSQTDYKKRIAATYDYHDTSGNLLFQVVRFEPKDFRQRRPDGSGGYINNIQGVKIVPYNLSSVIEATHVIIVEGEKDADCLKSIGLMATCSPMGAGKWKPQYNEYFRGKHIAIIPDNDEPGRKHVQDVAKNLKGIAASVRIVNLPDLPDKGDVTDYLATGKTADDLREIIRNTPELVTDITDVTADPEETINTDLIPIIPFSLDVFPKKFRKIVKSFSQALDVSPGFYLSIKLPIIAGAIGNTVRVSPNPDWKVPVQIWQMIIAKSGGAKTPAIYQSMKPIDQRQAESFKKYSKELKEYYEETRKRKKSSKKDRESLTPICTLSSPDEPKFIQYKVEDSTVEALIDVFVANPRGAIFERDEISGLIRGYNQYKSQGDDREKYMELFEANPWTRNRKGIIQHAPNTGLSIIGGIQPEKLPKVFESESHSEGFTPRFLMCFDDSKPRTYSKNRIPENDLKSWEALLEYCYAIPLKQSPDDGIVEPKILSLDSHAEEIFAAFHDEYQNLTPFVTKFAQPFIPKLITYSLKLAGVLAVIEAYSEKTKFEDIKPINADTMNNAISLTGFYAGQAMKVLRLYENNTAEKNEYEKRLIRTLHAMQDDVSNAQLLLSPSKSHSKRNLLDEFNRDLPEKLKHSSEKIVGLLGKLNLKTQKGSRNLSYVIWEPKKLKKLFSEITVTTVTSINDQDTDVTVVTDASGESE